MTKKPWNLGYVFFILNFTCTINLFAQHAVVIGSSKYKVNYRNHAGYLILNNAEKVDGIFEYAMDEFPTYNLKLFSSERKIIRRYRIKEINKLVLAGADTSLTGKDSTYFETFENHKLFYRQLTFGDIKIYDERFFNVDEVIGLVYPILTIIYQDKMYKIHTSKELQPLLYSFGMKQFSVENKLSLENLIRNLNGLPIIKN